MNEKRLSGTYCPLCGTINLFVSVQAGKKIAHCGPDLKFAHTAWEIGPDVESTHKIWGGEDLEPPKASAHNKEEVGHG